MKIVRDGVVYVQKNDLARLMHSNSLIPASVFNYIFKDGALIVVNENRYEFVKFSNEEDIDFFNCLDWIVDYDKLKCLSDDEIIEFGKSIAKEQKEIADSYNFMSKDEKKKNRNLIDKYDLLEHKFYSVRDFLWFRQGHIQMELPENIEYPLELNKPKEIKVEEKGIKKLVKLMFNRKRNT